MSDRRLPRALRVVLQVLAYGAFAAVLGYFSTSPAYRLRGDDEALVKLSFTHSARLMRACRERSESELAKLAPNMRQKMDCPRERAPVRIELDMDGRALYRIEAPPAGLHRDGAATVYRRLAIPAGRHQFRARLADGPEGEFRFSGESVVELAPGQVLIVDFATDGSGFVFTRG
ncbi:MAG: hypothetical protein IT513_01470 [Burkholderiales bacterium]|nr:hypothetical protein [Burkholderiales bacterium]